jgi:hypothetical protein
MPRPSTQARAARKLRRVNPWIATTPDATALAQMLVTLAETMDDETNHDQAGVALAYLATRDALIALAPEARDSGVCPGCPCGLNGSHPSDPVERALWPWPGWPDPMPADWAERFDPTGTLRRSAAAKA